MTNDIEARIAAELLKADKFGVLTKRVATEHLAPLVRRIAEEYGNLYVRSTLSRPECWHRTLSAVEGEGR